MPSTLQATRSYQHGKGYQEEIIINGFVQARNGCPGQAVDFCCKEGGFRRCDQLTIQFREQKSTRNPVGSVIAYLLCNSISFMARNYTKSIPKSFQTQKLSFNLSSHQHETSITLQGSEEVVKLWTATRRFSHLTDQGLSLSAGNVLGYSSVGKELSREWFQIAGRGSCSHRPVYSPSGTMHTDSALFAQTRCVDM